MMKAAVVLVVLGVVAAGAFRMDPSGAMNPAPHGSSSLCNICSSFLETSSSILHQVTRLSSTEQPNSCEEMCNQLGDGHNSGHCNLLCSSTGLLEFGAMFERPDANPDYMCELKSLCTAESSFLELESAAFLSSLAPSNATAQKTAADGSPKKIVSVTSDINISGNLITPTIQSPTGNLIINAEIEAPSVKAETASVTNADIGVVSTNVIKAPSGTLNVTGSVNTVRVFTGKIASPTGTLVVSGNAAVSNQVSAKTVSTNIVTSGVIATSTIKSPSGLVSVNGSLSVESGVIVPRIESPTGSLWIQGDVTVANKLSSPTVAVSTIEGNAGRVALQGDMSITGTMKTRSIRSLDKSIVVNGDLRVAGIFKIKTAVIERIRSVGGNLTIAGDLSVTGKVNTQTMSSPSGVMDITGNIQVSGGVKTDNLEALGAAQTNFLQTEVMTGKDGNPVNVQGDMHADGSIHAPSMSSDSLKLAGVEQWRLVSHENFESDQAAGWSQSFLSTCESVGDAFLGGHCNAASEDLVKKFTNLPPHSQIRVTARYHFIDNWQGETAFAKVDDKVAWLDTHHAPAAGHGVNMCGNEAHAESRMSAPLHFSMPHTDSSFQLSFGSTLANDPCAHSFGIDDVSVYVR